MNSLTISVPWMVFFAVFPVIYTIIVLGAVALGGFLVYRTKRGEDSSLFGVGQPKVGSTTIAPGGPDDYGVFADDIEDGTDVNAAMNIINKVNERAMSQMRGKGGNN